MLTLFPSCPGSLETGGGVGPMRGDANERPYQHSGCTAGGVGGGHGGGCLREGT
jgi:hypothetical protein